MRTFKDHYNNGLYLSGLSVAGSHIVKTLDYSQVMSLEMLQFIPHKAFYVSLLQSLAEPNTFVG